MSSMTSSKVPVAQLSSTTATEPDPVGKSIEEIASDNAQEKAILSWCKNQYERCKNQRIPNERKWYLYLAFYFGRQNVVVVKSAATTNGFQLHVPKAPPWRVRLVINRIRLIIRKQVAVLCQQKPRFYSVPASTSDEDLMSCRVAEGILDAFYREEDMETVTRTAVWWASVCGTSFTKTYWDKNATDKNGIKGKICSEAVAPFYVYIPDLLQPNIELQPYVIHATTMSPDTAKNRYNLDVTPNVVTADNILEDQFLNLVSGQAVPKKDQVLNLEFWVKPGLFKKFPKGAFITICGDKLVQYKEGNPYEHGQFPFAKVTDIDTGSFYGESIIADVMPLQREFNRTRSQIVEAKNLMAKPKLLASRGSVNATQITSEPGQVIYYTPGFEKPTPLQLIPLPNYVLETVTQLQNDMDDLTGQHDISGLISSRTSATALSYVQNADALITSSTSTSIEKMVEKVGRQVLSLVKQYWATPRLVRVVGLDESFEAQQWSRSNLTDNTEVYIESGSALPQDKSARQAFLMDLLKMGAIKPQQLLEALDMGGIDKLYEDYLIDKRQAQRENIQMIKFAEDNEVPETNFTQQLVFDILGIHDDTANAGVANTVPTVANPTGATGSIIPNPSPTQSTPISNQ